jgi:hypothetical protein
MLDEARHLSVGDAPLKHRGAYNEHLAIAWLIAQGYEVFRNVSAHGIIDIIACRGAETIRLDVKSRAVGSTNNRSAQLEAGVKLLVVGRSGTFEIIDLPVPARRVCVVCTSEFTPKKMHHFTCSPACHTQREISRQKAKREAHLALHPPKPARSRGRLNAVREGDTGRYACNQKPSKGVAS